ncbi:MAG TPA: pyridoxal phosphate-dependent aminotransferase family protein [Planctomycetota bacterium]|jgi:8-amino-7-oxononanoate synthase|nr:pyridoxal phosphate-dependent aminotransferase family protein [Planctomycetota bacterium]
MGDLFDKCARFVTARELMAGGTYPYFRAIGESEATEVVIDGRRLIMAGSNNYLGLTHHPHVLEAARRAIQRFGSGCTGSRFLNGTLSLHEELERRLARFMQREAALVFSTGFQTNLGIISALVGRNDVVYSDGENHASILDGCRLSFGEVKKFKHNDMEHLERLLAEGENGEGGRLIVVDGVFSMLGDFADLPRICALARRYGARTLVDEAHSLGVLGSHGRGTAEHFGVENRVDLVMGTFSKSLASIGGFVAGPEEVLHYLKHHARSLMFSASMPPASTAAVIAALDVLEREPGRRMRVMQNAEFMRCGLRDLGYETGIGESAIVPILVGDRMGTFRLWKELFDEGVFTNPVTSPAVPPGKDLIRTSYMASHTPAQLERVLVAFERAGRRLGMLPPLAIIRPSRAGAGRRGGRFEATLGRAKVGWSRWLETWKNGASRFRDFTVFPRRPTRSKRGRDGR